MNAIESIDWLYSSQKNSAVFFALLAGLETKASIFIFLSSNLLAIMGASFFPLSFSGRSKSLKVPNSQLLFACRIISKILLSLVSMEIFFL